MMTEICDIQAEDEQQPLNVNARARDGQRRTSQPQLGHYPQHTEHNCCSIDAAVCGMNGIAQRFRNELLPNELLTRFALLKPAAANGFDVVVNALDLHNKKGQPLDGSHLMVDLLSRTTIGGVPAATRLDHGDELPQGKAPIVAFGYTDPITEPGGETTIPGHWCGYRCLGQNGFMDGGRHVDHVEGDSSFYMWEKGQPHDRPRLGLGRGKCACGKRHTRDEDWGTCDGCGKTFVGACIQPPIPGDHDENWRCTACIQQQQLPPPAALAAPAPPLPPVPARRLQAGAASPPGALPQSLLGKGAPNLIGFDQEMKRLYDVKREKCGTPPKHVQEMLSSAEDSFHSLALSAASKFAPDEDPTRRQAQASGLAELTGAEFGKITIVQSIKESAASKLAINGLAESTRRFHLSEARSLQRFATQYSASLAQLTMPAVILAYLRWLTITSDEWWQAQTVQRRCFNLLGMLAALPLYSSVSCGISVKQCREVAATLARLNLLAAESQPTNQRASTWEDIQKAIEQEPNEAIQIAILLQWFLAARAGDILSLRKRNVTLKGQLLDVTVTDGKGTKLRKGHYSVHTKLPPELAEKLRRYLNDLHNGDLIVKPTAHLPEDTRINRMNTALKRASAGLTTRTIRRGALQAMALGTASVPPVPLETLMAYAGHLRPETTKRYLDWGRLFGAQAVAERNAADALTGTKAPTA